MAKHKRTSTKSLDALVQLEDWGSRGVTRTVVRERAVAVDRGIPGETVHVVVERGRRQWRGMVDHVEIPSPDRIAPPCPYYRQGCGGCQWQHVDYGAQVTTKRMLVNQELERVGLSARVDAAHAMDVPWRYRHTAAIALGWEAGFRPRGRRGIVEIHDCPIAHPAIGRFCDHLNVLLGAHTLPNYHGKMWLESTVVRVGGEAALAVLIQGIGGLTLETNPELPAVASVLAELSGIASVAFRHRDGSAIPLRGPAMNSMMINGRSYFVPTGSFVQASVDMVPLVLDKMKNSLSGRHIQAVADVYGGIGTFGLPLAELVPRLTLIELDAAAVAAAEKTAASWGLHNVQFVSRHAERALPELSEVDLIVVDPPRSGLGADVTGAIEKSAAHSVFYVSCSPPSFAVDLAHLCAAGFTIESLEIFDFYPQTYHVESLAVLSR